MELTIEISAGSISERKWGGINKTENRQRLVAGLESKEDGARAGIREMYALTRASDLSEKPSSNWLFPHHELQQTGDKIVLVTNRNGLGNAVARLSSADLSKPERRRAARHLLSHYEEHKMKAPKALTEILNLSDSGDASFSEDPTDLDANEKKGDEIKGKSTGQVVTLSDSGEFMRGDKVIPPSFEALKSVELSMNLDCGEARMPIAGVESADFAEGEAPTSWPDGFSEDEKFWFGAYRAITATTVWKGEIPIDFGHKNGAPLKAATKMLVRKPVLVNHWKTVDAIIGSIREAVWHKGGAVGLEGERRPPGINVLSRLNLAHDWAKNLAPLMDDGDITDVSVGINFEIDPSHPKLEENDFWRLLGQEIDGHVVRLLVTRVTSIKEKSVVWAGADAFAEKLETTKD